MLSVKLDRALKEGAPPPGQPFPKESKKLGVDVCLLPASDAQEWRDESRGDYDSEDLGEGDEEAAADAAAVIADTLSGAVLNGGGSSSVAGEGGEAGLLREGSDWDAPAEAPGSNVGERGGEEGAAGLKRGVSDRVVVAVAPGEGGDAAAASSKQP